LLDNGQKKCYNKKAKRDQLTEGDAGSFLTEFSLSIITKAKIKNNIL
jgi:hypothetical protein